MSGTTPSPTAGSDTSGPLDSADGAITHAAVDDEAEERVVQRADEAQPRQRYELDETGFLEVPKRWRKFYRHWKGPEDILAPNEVICPVCKVVIRSYRDYRPGDRVYCMPCMSRLIIVERPDGSYEADVIYV